MITYRFWQRFYLSDKLGNARDWAIDKSGFSETPTVMRYEISNKLFEDEDISFHRFNHPIMEWLNFVKDYRRKDTNTNNKKEPRHAHHECLLPMCKDHHWQ